MSLYVAAAVSALLAVALVFGRCCWTGSTDQLDDKWIFRTAAGAAPIPTYLLLMILPIDADLGASVLEDRIVVALAGLYGLVEAVKDVRDMAAKARRSKEAA